MIKHELEAMFEQVDQKDQQIERLQLSLQRMSAHLVELQRDYDLAV